jgi:hypothetical protein
MHSRNKHTDLDQANRTIDELFDMLIKLGEAGHEEVRKGVAARTFIIVAVRLLQEHGLEDELRKRFCSPATLDLYRIACFGAGLDEAFPDDDDLDNEL